MRYFAKLSNDPHTVFSCRRGLRDNTSQFLENVGIRKAVNWRYAVKTFRITATWTIDPSTSTGGNTTYTRFIDVTRPLSAPHLERNLLFPGVKADVDTNPGLGLLLATYPVFTWSSPLVVAGIDDVFLGTLFEAELRLFWDGYKIPGDDDGPTTDFCINPTMRLRLGLTYDDGTEGVLYIDTTPTRWELEGGGIGSEIAAVGSIDSHPVDLRAGDTVDHDLYFQGPPVVTIVPIEWYGDARKGGGEPIRDGATGSLFLNPLNPQL